MAVKGDIRKYLGSIPTEKSAAEFYDKYCIIMWGLEAKTNFNYTQQEAIQLLYREDRVDRAPTQQQENTSQNCLRG